MNCYDLPDHPVIQSMERTGYPDGKEPCFPRCPVCGNACETIYKTNGYEIIGCDLCLRPVDAWACSECFQREE